MPQRAPTSGAACFSSLTDWCTHWFVIIMCRFLSLVKAPKNDSLEVSGLDSSEEVQHFTVSGNFLSMKFNQCESSQWLSEKMTCQVHHWTSNVSTIFKGTGMFLWAKITIPRQNSWNSKAAWGTNDWVNQWKHIWWNQPGSNVSLFPKESKRLHPWICFWQMLTCQVVQECLVCLFL